MPYRFSATTGNIVRPIEALCLDTSTGALNYPMRYGPAGTAITMWNGVVEFYSTFTRYWPTTLFNGSGTYSNSQYAYDEQDANSGTPITTSQHISYYTTYASASSSSNTASTLTYRIPVPSDTSVNVKIIWGASTTAGTLTGGDCYGNCGEGAYVPYFSEAFFGSVYLEYSTDGTTYYSADSFATPTGGTQAKKLTTISSVLSSSGFIYVKLNVFGAYLQLIDACNSGPMCGGTTYLTGNAEGSGSLFAVCAETV